MKWTDYIEEYPKLKEYWNLIPQPARGLFEIQMQEYAEEYHKEKMKEIDTLNDSYMAGFKDGADWILEEITPKLIQNCINESGEIFDKEFYKNIDAIQIICKYCGHDRIIIGEKMRFNSY